MNDELSFTTQIAVLAIQLGVILFAARTFGNLAQKIHVPSVLGELISGILIGPFVLGSIGLPLTGFEQGLFPVSATGLPVSTLLYALATLGSVVLLFMSGLETDLQMFFRYSVTGTIVGLGGVIFSFSFGDLLGVWMYHTSFMDPRCLFLGILCTATSVGITARILSERKSMDTPEGTTILAGAVIDDVLGIICLAIVMGIVGTSAAGSEGSVAWKSIAMIALKSVGIWLGVTAIGLIFAHQIAAFLKKFSSSGVVSILAFGLALLLSGLFEEAGLAMIIGAYVMGLSLSKTDIAFSVQRHLDGIYHFLVPVFFVVMGMLVDVRVFGDSFVLKYGLLYAFLAIVAKIIGCALPAYFMNFNLLGSLRIGMGMIPRGEVALIIAGIGSTTMMIVNGEKVPIVNSELFGIAIIMTLLTTLAAPPLLAFILEIKGKGVKHDIEDKTLVHTMYEIRQDVFREFVIGVMIDNFQGEGFRHSELDRGGGVTHFRRKEVTFTLSRYGISLDFESDERFVPLIRTVMYETFVEIYDAISTMKDFPIPAGGLKKDVFCTSAALRPQTRAPMPVHIGHIISQEGIVSDLKSQGREEIIHELIDALATAGLLRDTAVCERDVLARELVASTSMPGGIALPHARTEGADKLIAAVGISRHGCLFDEKGQEKTHIFVLSLCPKNSSQPYLQFIAHIADVLSSPENIEKLIHTSDSDQIRNIFIADSAKEQRHERERLSL